MSHVIGVALCFVIGCGDNVSGTPSDAGSDAANIDPAPVCLDPSGPDVPEGPLTSADELDTTTCDPSSLNDADFLGSFRAGKLFRVDTCEGGLEVRGLTNVGPADDLYIKRDERGLFIRSATGRSVDVLHICGASSDGTLSGVSRLCFLIPDMDPSCGASQPVSITPFERHNGEGEASGLELVSEINATGGVSWDTSYVSNVEYEDGRVYLSRAGGGLHVFDASSRLAPVELGFIELPFVNDIKAFTDAGRRYVIVADAETSIIDVTDGSSPQVVSSLGIGSHRIDVDVSMTGQRRAFVGDGFSAEVPIFDISNPLSPSSLGTVVLSNPAAGVHAPTMFKGTLYAAGSIGGMHIVDPFPDPATPTYRGSFVDGSPYSHHVGVFEIGGMRYALHNDEVGEFPYFKVLDVSVGSPTFLNVLGEYKTRDYLASHNIKMVGTRAFITYYQDGVRILDLSDPSAPSLAAYFNTWQAETAPHAFFEGAVDVDVDPSSGAIYVADTPRGLLVLRETSP